MGNCFGPFMNYKVPRGDRHGSYRGSALRAWDSDLCSFLFLALLIGRDFKISLALP